jgi:hypothetical protein
MRKSAIILIISISLLLSSSFCQNSLEGIVDPFDAYMKGFLEISKDGAKFNDFLPCRNLIVEQEDNIRTFIWDFNRTVDYNYFVRLVNATNPISDTFGDILTHCLPAFKQIDTYIDSVRNIINKDSQSFINFIIDSIKHNYIEFSKEALEIYDLTSNYYRYDRNQYYFFYIAGRVSGFFYNRLRINSQKTGFLKN